MVRIKVGIPEFVYAMISIPAQVGIMTSFVANNFRIIWIVVVAVGISAKRLVRMRRPDKRADISFAKGGADLPTGVRETRTIAIGIVADVRSVGWKAGGVEICVAEKTAVGIVNECAARTVAPSFHSGRGIRIGD